MLRHFIHFPHSKMQFLHQGHETTSTFCVWAIYCLTKYPNVHKLVLEDILKHAPTHGQITLDSLEKMSYFEAFLYEVLRMYPPWVKVTQFNLRRSASFVSNTILDRASRVGMIVRSAGEGVNLFGENIPPGTRVMIPIYLLHRNPDYWTEPECFKPERWMDQKSGKRLSSVLSDNFHHFAYLPFSAVSLYL